MKIKHVKHKMVILATFILGIMLSIYIKTLDSNKVYMSLEQKREVEHQIELKKKEIEKLKKSKLDYNKILAEYEKVIKDDNKSVKDILQGELEDLKEISGYSNIVDDGIVVTISDSKRELENGQNPNDLIVHDIDILRILNDLKKAGAKAISINGERVISTSEIKCSGATITVNETTYGQPFVIIATGNIENLKASMISPESYANLLRDVYGISIKVDEKNNIIVKSYEKSK